MYLIVLISYLIVTINTLSTDILEKDFQLPIEKLLLINQHLYLGTVNSLHRLSSLTLNQTISTLHFPSTYHWKVLSEIDNDKLLLCGTLSQGVCQLIDRDFNLIINSSIPTVANDPQNSTISLIIPEKNLVYFGVTYTNDGAYRWQIPNIAGRSLNTSRFMKILSANDDDGITRDDLSLRFMSRQQTTFIVQYIYSFSTKNYIYFLTNQPNDLGERIYLTKLVRFCRQSSNSLIRTYTEIPLICSNSEWILKTADFIRNENNDEILIGHFTRKDGSGGTTVCSWHIKNDIDRALTENYRRCYSMGIGQRGLAFIKPNEPCRKDEGWSIPNNADNLCPYIDNDRLPYPVGGIQPVVGRLIYENLIETSSAFQMHSIGSIRVIFQGLTNGTLKLGLFDFRVKINWFYSSQLSSQLPILSNIQFDSSTATYFFASGSKIYRLSFESDCSSRLSCDECLSSSTNPLCGWCTMNQRCTLINKCLLNFWQRESNQCTQIVNVEPMKVSVDNSQWINLTLSKLPQLEHNEIYECIFKDKTMSANSQAIKLDHNRLSCPTPSSQRFSIENNSHSTVRLSVIKSPSNISIAIVPEFTFYNCSFYSSCVSCREEIGCQWCSQRCSSVCTEPTTQCASFSLVNPLDIYLPSGQSVDIPMNLNGIKNIDGVECRLNETIRGKINSRHICSFNQIPLIENENNQQIFLSIYENDILIGHRIEMFIYRCDLYESCDQCQTRGKCSWCQGRCSTTNCSINEQCTSLRIRDFSPKILPLNGQTVITIELNENSNEKIEEIRIANIPCLILNSSEKIQCRAGRSNRPLNGQISIQFSKSIYILSKEMIEYRQVSIKSVNPQIAFELGGQILHFNGENLLIGNEQKIFIGNYQCLTIKPMFTNTLSCRLPSILPGFYNISLQIDQHILNVEQKFQVTPNPIVQDIDPTVSFASGGRLVTIRGMYFNSAQSITVRFSYKKWNARLKINSNEIIARKDESISTFSFRTPGIPSPSNEFPSPPFDVNFSLFFDNSILSLTNLIQFRYIPDVLLNISSIPPTLPYTGEELKLQVENLTEAASLADIQLLIGCSECKLKTFTSKGITCQPPTQLTTTTTAIILNNQQTQDDCSFYNSSIGPIRFRIGYREYLIGYLSYTRLNPSKNSLFTMISLIFASCLLTIALLTLGIYLFLRIRNNQKDQTSSTTNPPTEKPFWSTDTSASTCPYYQVYEQISTLSSHDNTLTRAPLLHCPYYQHEKRSTPPIIEQLQMNLTFLSTISIENDQLKKLVFSHNQSSSIPSRQSMELFYDLLNMKPFSQAFLDQLIQTNSFDLLQSYIYLFRYTPENLQSFASTRQNLFLKFFVTLFHQTKSNLISKFHLFDDFLRILNDYLDSSPIDEILNRSTRSLCSSTLLPTNLQYQTIQLTIDYEHFFRFHISVLDCDTIDQIKSKIIRYLNSHENTYRIVDYEQLDLILPPLNICLCTNQVPMLKNYLINSTIYCQKKNTMKKCEKKTYLYHLCRDNQLIDDEKFIREKLFENKHHLQQIFIHFFQQIINGLDLFQLWNKELNEQNNQLRFQQYIQVVSELIRRLNQLMLCRSTCPIIESWLNIVADGLEFVFDTKTDFSPEIEMLFMDEKKYFASFDKTNFHFHPTNYVHPTLSSFDIRSLTLADDYAIECLFKLYQFYELFSEPINQHIGENHVSVLLPVHHLLVQIRQLLQSDTTTLI